MARSSAAVLGWLITLLLGLSSALLIVGGLSYMAVTFVHINQEFKRRHADTSSILHKHSGLKEIPYASKFWAQAVKDNQEGVLGPTLVHWVEQTGLYRLVTAQSWLTVAIFALLAALAVYTGISACANIVNGMIMRRENSKALGDNLLLAIQAVQRNQGQGAVRAAVTSH